MNPSSGCQGFLYRVNFKKHSMTIVHERRHRAFPEYLVYRVAGQFVCMYSAKPQMERQPFSAMQKILRKIPLVFTFIGVVVLTIFERNLQDVSLPEFSFKPPRGRTLHFHSGLSEWLCSQNGECVKMAVAHGMSGGSWKEWGGWWWRARLICNRLPSIF